MKKILFIAPHLSTGGLPQYLFRKIKELNEHLEVYCIEYENITGGRLVVQRDRIVQILGSRFYSIGEDKKDILRIIHDLNPDFIHIEEIPEYFLPSEITESIYTKNRTYKIFETSHDSSFDPEANKIYIPDAFFFVSDWQIKQYNSIKIPKYLAEYPIDYRERPDRKEGLRKLGLDPSKKHVLNVGLFTPRKNQAELFEVAKSFDDSVQFHFVGNQADNFRNYWEPLLSQKPSNCIVWGERADTDNFYACMDAFYFASRGNQGDKETMPLVLKEALGWGMNILMHNLDVYLGYFDKFGNVTYLNNSPEQNAKILSTLLEMSLIEKPKTKSESFETWYEIDNHIFQIKCLNDATLSEKQLIVVLSDNWNNLTSYSFEMKYVPETNMWFKSHGFPAHFNGYRVEIFEKETGALVHSKLVCDFMRTEKICPMVKGKCVDIKHDKKDHSSWFTFYEVFLRNDYDNINEDDVVVDIGSNLGYVSLYAVNKGASKVISVEPDPTNFEYLKENTKDFPQIIPVQYAISDKRGETDFYQGEASSIATTYSISENISSFQYSKNSIKVKTIDPNSLIEELGIERIDFLKIDCEGAEFEFFRAIDEKYLSEKVKYITGEVHRFAGSQSDYEEVIKSKLLRCGFEVTENNSLDTNTEFFFKAKKRPKIKIVHLLNSPDELRERESIASLRELEKYGIAYEQVVTPLYKSLPPKENCNRPEAVSEFPGDYLLGPGHYGCYLAHRKGITEGFSEGVDAVLLNECDSILQFSAKEMAEKIFEAYDLAIKYDLAYISFGKKIPNKIHANPENEFYITDELSEAHCILVTKEKSDYFKSKFETSPWDVSDLWYNVFIREFKKGIFSRPYSLQHPGVSNIDFKFKDGYLLHEDNSLMHNFQNNDISVIVQTCDEYEFLWRGWYLSFKNNWDWSLGWPIYFCTENKSTPFKDKRIENLKTTKSNDSSGFSNRLMQILSSVKTKYVLYIQDDMWLKSKVNGEELKRCLYLMKHFDWNSIKVHEKIWFNYNLQKTNIFIGEKRVLKYRMESDYLITHNASIWNREFLLKSMVPNENPWRNEIDGTERVRQNYADAKIFHYNMGWYYQLGIQQGGQFTPFGEELNRQLLATEEDRVRLDII